MQHISKPPSLTNHAPEAFEGKSDSTHHFCTLERAAEWVTHDQEIEGKLIASGVFLVGGLSFQSLTGLRQQCLVRASPSNPHHTRRRYQSFAELEIFEYSNGGITIQRAHAQAQVQVQVQKGGGPDRRAEIGWLRREESGKVVLIAELGRRGRGTAY
jgi:hypothetical protein